MQPLLLLNSSHSPIQWLPPEILGDIFIHCLPCGDPTVMHVHGPPLSLTHVCRMWRKVTFASPLLWTHLSLTVSDLHSFARAENLINLVRLWFSASTSCFPIYFSLDCWNSVRPPKNSNNEAVSIFVTKALLPYTNRYRSLQFTIGLDSISGFAPFLTLPEGHVEQLETLFLMIPSPVLNSLVSQITVFESAPCLRKVSLDIEDTHFSNLRFLLPWAQLTHLSMLYVPIPLSAWPSLLRKCRQLVCGAFSVVSANDTFDAPIEHHNGPCVLADLVELRIRFQLDDPRMTLFDDFVFPSLSNLQLEGDFTPLSSHLITDLRHHISGVHYLALACLIITPADLLTLLHAAPSLTYLKLDLDADADDCSPMIEALVYKKGQACYIPRLKTLNMYIPLLDFSTFSGTFLRMVQSRRMPWIPGPPPPVAFLDIILRLDYRGDIEPDFLSFAHELPKEHFDMQIVDSEEMIMGDRWF